MFLYLDYAACLKIWGFAPWVTVYICFCVYACHPGFVREVLKDPKRDFSPVFLYCTEIRDVNDGHDLYRVNR